jgi:hydroxyacylglutathione hydrolase
MILKRFYDPKLAQASYLIACGRSGSAIVIDPLRDVEPYLRAAESDGVRITDVTETHIHADFLSGTRELASRTGAQTYLSGEGGRDWSYEFTKADRATLLRDGDVIEVGNIRLTAMHTPGHTPEHLTFLVTDGAVADEPMGALTGDFVFVGDVGRPDLLERAAKMEGTMLDSARQLYASLQRFAALPDWLQIWPGHGAGSACGKGISAVPHSSLGYERRFNWAFTAANEAEFLRDVLRGQPEPPAYFATMKQMNRAGPPLLGTLVRPPRLDAERLTTLAGGEAMIVDTRAARVFADHHVPGTLNIPLDKSFTNWAGSLLPYDRALYLIIEDNVAGRADEAMRDLALIGLDRVEGYFGVDAITAWRESGRPLESVEQASPARVAPLLGTEAAQIIDVRNSSEWEAGHLPGVPNIPLATLPDRLHGIDRDRPVIVHCQSGARSSIAASVLKAHGFDDVKNLVGGYGAWREAGLPTDDGRSSLASHP